MAQQDEVKKSSYSAVIPPMFEEAVEKSEEEYVEHEDAEDSNILELDDGSAVVLDPEDKNPGESEFAANLVTIIDPLDLGVLANQLIEDIERDKTSREDRDKQYAEGIKRTGLGKEAPGGATFEGASTAVHPVLAEGCVDFASRAIKEIFPAKGPVKTNIIVASDDEKLAKANRKEKYLNWQLSNQIEEYRDDLEQLLTQVPLGGSQYKKWWFDKALGRPACKFISIDNVFLPYAAPNIYMARRATVYEEITAGDFDGRVDSGFYEITNSSQEGEPGDNALFVSSSREASEKIEGKDQQHYDNDGLRGIYECYVYLDIGADHHNKEGREVPYVVHLDINTGTILAVYRNWREDDKRFRKLDWVVEYKFIPWRGAYGIGLIHLIGSLAAALTGGIRALLDSALINNFPGLLKLKGSGQNAQTKQVETCSITELEGSGSTDDIRKLIMPMPFSPPSLVLMQLIDKLTEYAKGVVNTAEERIADAGANMPVGTALALIEQGSITFSAIHSRLHASQARELRILCRINALYVDEEEQKEVFGAVLVTKEDFETTDDVIPVSDPNIFSDAQRFAQLQSVMQLAEKFPDLYDTAELNEIALELLKFPNAERVMLKKPTPFHANAVAENVACATGAVLLAAPDDDQVAHLITHLQFINDPITGLLVQPPGLMNMAEHVRQHMLFYYALTAKKVGEEAGGGDMNAQINGKDHTAVDAALASQSEATLEQMTGSLGVVMQLYQGMQQKVQQAQQAQQQAQMAMDPVQVQAKAAMAETERRAARDKEDIAIEKIGLQESTRQAMETLAAKTQNDLNTFKADLIKMLGSVMPIAAARELAVAEAEAQPSAQQQELPLEPVAQPMPPPGAMPNELPPGQPPGIPQPEGAV